MDANELRTDVADMNLTNITKTILDSKDTSSQSLCTHCAQPATQTCNGCADAPLVGTEQSAKTFYCNSLCQTADWPHHKQTCKSLCACKRLYRAGDIVQRIFYVYREHTYDHDITKVGKSENTMYLFERLYGKDILYPFPHHLFQSEEDKRAALGYCACSVAVAFMHQIITMILKGLYTKIDEIHIYLQETPRMIYTVDQSGEPDMSEYGHSLLRVTLKGGEQYAFDLAGAQFGYHETITPWSLYVQTRAEAGSIRVFPYDHTLNMILADISESATRQAVTMRYRKSLANVAKVLCEEYGATKGNVPVCEMLKLAQGAFEEEREHLVYCVGNMLTWFKAELKRQDRLPQAPSWLVGVRMDGRDFC